MFDRNIQHLLAILVSLSNTCGGIVYLTANSGMELTTDTFNVFHNRLIELVYCETKLPKELMEVRTFKNLKFWGCVIVEKSQHKFNYCPLQPTTNSTMARFEYWSDILGFIHAQGAVSEEYNEPVTKCTNRAAAEIPGVGAEIPRAAAEILEAPARDDYPTKENDAAQCSTVNSPIGNDDSGDTPDSPEEIVNYSMYSKLDWSNNKRDWEKYVKTKHLPIDEIIKSCPMWEPATPMRVTPDLGALKEMFGSEAQRDEILSRIATEGPGFAIVCKTWSFFLPEKIYQT